MAQAVAYILDTASRPTGVTAAEVAEYCGITETPARSRINVAVSENPGVLIKAERELGFRRLDVRWFIHQHHADAFRHGRTADCAGPRSQVTTVQLPTQQVPAAHRTGALDFADCGSRRGNWIYFRDGSRVPFDPKATTQKETTHV